MKEEVRDLMTLEGNIHGLELAMKALMQYSGFVPARETIEALRREAESLSTQRGGAAFSAGATSTLDAIFGDQS